MSSESHTLGDFFPAEEIAQAIDACRKQDRRLDMYHKFASPTAKAFIELGFYSTHFGDQVDRELYAQCRDAIAPTLTDDDIRYLLRFETGPDTREFLEELLRGRNKPKLRLRRPASAPAGTMPVASQQPPAPVSTTNPPPRISRRPRRIRIEVDGGLLKLLALLIAVGGIVFLAVNFMDLDFFRPKPQPPKPEAAKRESPAVARTPSAPCTRTSHPPKAVCPQQPVEKTSHLKKPTAHKPLAHTDGTKTTVADFAVSNVLPQTAAMKVKARARKLVLTDGTSIKTRPDGTIEVPRAFSYAGARLGKPFWIYDRQLEKSGRIENEARAQKAAMDKWKALFQEAVQAKNSD